MYNFDKTIKNILGKPKNRKKDWDLDGVPNKRDCQPRNPMRQDKRVRTPKSRKSIMLLGYSIGDRVYAIDPFTGNEGFGKIVDFSTNRPDAEMFAGYGPSANINWEKSARRGYAEKWAWIPITHIRRPSR